MSAQSIARWLLVAAIVILGLYWYPTSWTLYGLILVLYPAVSASLLAISLTVLLIDRAHEQRAQRDLKQRLLREMGSSDHGFAVRAAKELAAAGWLLDGSLRSLDLTFANLERAQMREACLEGVILAGATLRHTNLEGANLRHANLEDVKAENMRASKARLGGAVLRAAKLRDAILDEIDAEEDIDFIGASLISVKIRNANLKKARLEECDLRGADLTGTNLAEANLQEVDVEDATLDEVNLERADLSGLLNWSKIRSIRAAKISGVRNAPDGFRQWAVQHGALEFVVAREMAESAKLAEARRPADNNSISVEEPGNNAGRAAEGAVSPPGASTVTDTSSTRNDDSQGSKRFDPESDELRAGDSVSHEKFGVGIVVSVAGSGPNTEAKVNFGGSWGVKHLVLRYAPLVKLEDDGRG